jgi:hypothetical protein
VPGNDEGRRLTKAERRDQARFERLEIERRQAARARNRNIFIVIGVVLVAVVIGLLVILGGGGDGGQSASSTPPSVTLPDPATLKGILQTPPPWTNNTDQLEARLADLKLPELSDAPGALHHHVQLDIYVDGQPVEVPANIGLSQQAASPLHTHDPTGLVHVESADPNFQPVLGQFMDVWGPYMTTTCLGDTCNDGDRQLRVFVNGDRYTGDPTLLPLTDQLVVVVTFGTEDQLPDPIPDTFPTI